MINLAYFIKGNPETSETFIKDLIEDFQLDNQLNLTLVSGESNKNSSSKIIYTNFYDSGYKLSFLLFKLGSFIGQGEKFKISIRKILAFSSLKKKSLNQLKIDIAYVDYATTAYLLLNYLIERDIPLIVHVHGYDITARLKTEEEKEEFQKLCKYVKVFIAASEYIKRILILNGCPSSKIKVIRLGVSNNYIRPITWEKRKKNKPSLCFLGRLTPKKNPIALLHAFDLVLKENPELVLHMIGDGPLLADVKKRIKSLGLVHNVILHGALSREEAFPILNKAWVYVQHSVSAPDGDQEGFAISLAEAALFGIPVVSTIHNGIPENVMDNETGYLVPEFDYEMMADKIVKLINNPKLAEEMGKNGRSHILNICNASQRRDKIIRLFKTIICEA